MKTWIVACLCSFLLMVGVPVLAKVEYTTVQSSGQGKRADQALSKALSNAVSQVNGAQTAQSMDIRETSDRVYVGWYGAELEIPGKEVNKGYTKTYSDGMVRSYKVLSTQFDEKSAEYTVTIEAQVQKIGDYANIGKDRGHLLALVVAPLATTHFDYEGLSGKEQVAMLSERLSSLLSDELARSDRFRVLDRANLSVSLNEQMITQVLGAKTGQQIKFNQSLSADLVVVGQIEEFAIRPEKASSAVFPRYRGDVVMAVRVIEMATQEVRFAERVERRLNHDQIAPLLAAVKGKAFGAADDTDKRRTQRLIEANLMAQVSDVIVQTFYPDYVRRTRDDRLPAAMRNEPKTQASDSPGSSERPWSYDSPSPP